MPYVPVLFIIGSSTSRYIGHSMCRCPRWYLHLGSHTVQDIWRYKSQISAPLPFQLHTCTCSCPPEAVRMLNISHENSRVAVPCALSPRYLDYCAFACYLLPSSQSWRTKVEFIHATPSSRHTTAPRRPVPATPVPLSMDRRLPPVLDWNLGHMKQQQRQ